MTISTSEKIRILCKRQNLSISELAERLETSSQNLSHKLKRDNFPEKDLQAIAEALGYKYESSFIIENDERF
ncbi:helix-turn-helix domain-containing protein [Petrocella sp. FN5]|uniref:helix-turn-helix domain-containing protein n=1 Tax=Petrocella sp. FN5 TaxID=3032002 RepID=UPI0023DAA785|nr:helix-turn-helix transcriptional regulator [Petrocella sp. FN5]MDF1617215.1 helix-turn-helix transcriptional regulator [Petrocella sp. FN5]